MLYNIKPIIVIYYQLTLLLSDYLVQNYQRFYIALTFGNFLQLVTYYIIIQHLA